MATSAGYSGTALPTKLGIKPGARVLFVHAPRGFDDTLGALPPGVTVVRRAVPALDVVLLFVTHRDELRRRFHRLAESLDPAGGLWVAWPKRASDLPTDLTFDVVQRTGLDAGLVDNKICAIDEVWSGLRFVYRRSDRPRR